MKNKVCVRELANVKKINFKNKLLLFYFRVGCVDGRDRARTYTHTHERTHAERERERERERESWVCGLQGARAHTHTHA